MKLFKIISLSVILISCINTKKHINENPTQVTENKLTDVEKENDRVNQEYKVGDEIFVGKKFYEQDELNYYLYRDGGIISKDSILTFSVYETDSTLIYSLEKLISFEDLRQYLILDTLKHYKKNIKTYEPYSLNKAVILRVITNEDNKGIYTLKNDNVIVKQP